MPAFTNPEDLIPRAQAYEKLNDYHSDVVQHMEKDCRAQLEKQRDKYEAQIKHLRDLRWRETNRLLDLWNPPIVMVKVMPQTNPKIPLLQGWTYLPDRIEYTWDRGSERRTNEYHMDQVFHAVENSNALIWDDFEHVVDSAMSGRNVVVIAYGQTGTGKSTTMMKGRGQDASLWERTVDKVLGSRFTIKLQSVQDHNGEPSSLMGPVAANGMEYSTELEYRRILEEPGFRLVRKNTDIPLSACDIRSKEHAEDALARISKFRLTSATDRNKHSSRSHAVTELQLINREGAEAGTITFVDCAGKEKVNEAAANKGSKAKAELLKKEAEYINSSLKNLNEMLRAITQQDRMAGSEALGLAAKVEAKKCLLTKLLVKALGERGGMLPCIFVIGHIHSAAHSSDENKSTMDFLQALTAQTLAPKIKTKPKMAVKKENAQELAELRKKNKEMEREMETLRKEKKEMETVHKHNKEMVKILERLRDENTRLRPTSSAKPS